MIELKPTTGVGGDCMVHYDLEFKKSMTVQELINFILKENNREWGTITAVKKNTVIKIDYKHGLVVKQSEAEQELLDSKIDEAFVVEDGVEWTIPYSYS